MLVQEQNKMNLIRKDGQALVKVIHMKHADMAEVNITGVYFVSKLKLLLKFGSF